MQRVILEPEVSTWILGLPDDTYDRVEAAIDMLAQRGPGLGRPLVDSITGSRHQNMMELRVGTCRILFAFDPTATRSCWSLATNAASGAPGTHRPSPWPTNVRRMARALERRHTMTGHTTWSDLREQRDTTPLRRSAAREALENQIAAYRLVEVRKARGLTQQQVATIMGISQRRVSAIERGDLDRSELTTLRTYIEALGGQIHIVAEFDEVTTQIA